MGLENSTNKADAEASVSYIGADCRRIHNSDEAFNKQFNQKQVGVSPGESKWLDTGTEMMVATVGSGIALTIFDEQLFFGVMAYFLASPDIIRMFPKYERFDNESFLKACSPMESAINEMKLHGAGKNRIRIRLFGGSNMPGDDLDMGTKNYIFVKEYLSRKGLKIMSEDVSGSLVRRVHFFPRTGNATRFTLKRKEDFIAINEQERSYFMNHS